MSVHREAADASKTFGAKQANTLSRWRIKSVRKQLRAMSHVRRNCCLHRKVHDTLILDLDVSTHTSITITNAAPPSPPMHLPQPGQHADVLPALTEHCLYFGTQLRKEWAHMPTLRMGERNANEENEQLPCQ
eukprot:1160989-Pelagomonas_calceolata.AAC.5